MSHIFPRQEQVIYDAAEYLRIREEELDYVYAHSFSEHLLTPEQMARRADFVIDFDQELLDRNLNKKFPLASSEDFGPQDARRICKVCSGIDCPGHNGLFLFPSDSKGKRMMIINPPFIKEVRDIMSIICHECYNVLPNVTVRYEAQEMEKIRKLPRAQKLPRLLILVGLGGTNKVSYAECTAPTITQKGKKIYCATKHKLVAGGDNKTTIVFEETFAHAPKKKAVKNKRKPTLVDSDEEEEIDEDEPEAPVGSKKGKAVKETESKNFNPRDAHDMLMNIPEDQLEFYIGRTRDELRAYFKTEMLIMPTKYRTSVSKDKPDKLTTCLSNIEKICRSADRNSTETIVKLTEEVAKYEQIIKEIQSGKRGEFRNKLPGKRANFSARAVIIPTANLPIDMVTIPEYLAKSALFFPEVVTESNIEALQDLVFAGNVGIVNKAAGGPNPWQDILVGQDNYSDRSNHILQIGDKLKRHARDGDLVAHGRQPTHHKQNVLGAQIKIVKGSAMGVATNAAEYYHGDFDGDQMWMAALQTLEARGELATVLNINRVIRTYQKNAAMIGVVYNGIVASALMTRQSFQRDEGVMGEDGEWITLPQWIIDPKTGAKLKTYPKITPELFKVATFTYASHPRLKTLSKRLAMHGVDPLSGAALFSALLPEDFFFQGGKKEGNKYVTIKNGVLINGMISKSTVGSGSNNTIVDRMLMMYEDGWKIASQFINDANITLSVFLDAVGFTVTYDDCYLGKDYRKAEQYQSQIYKRVEQIKQIILNATSDEDKQEIKRLMTEIQEWGSRYLTEAHMKELQGLVNQINKVVDKVSLPISDINAESLFEQLGPVSVYLTHTYQEDVYNKLQEIEYKISGMKLPETRLEEEKYEKDIRGLLNNLKEIGRDALIHTDDISNSLIFMSEYGAGAKGKGGNLYTIGVTIGEQLLGGKRFAKQLSEGTRCLATDRPYDVSPLTQGFVVDSYMSGLTPAGAFYAAMANRPGLVENAVTTHTVGQAQRYLQILLGDLTTKNGSTIFHNKVVLEWCYGADSGDGEYLEKVNNVYQSASLESMIEKINYLYA